MMDDRKRFLSQSADPSCRNAPEWMFKDAATMDAETTALHDSSGTPAMAPQLSVPEVSAE